MNVEQSGTSDYVVDASVIAKWYLRDEEYLDQADALLDGYLSGADVLICPHFTRYELSNAVTRAAGQGRISDDDAVAAVRAFAGLDIAWEADNDSRLLAAGSLARRFGISFYDALYVALGDELGMPLVTADRDLCEHIASGPLVVTFIEDIDF